MKSSMGTYQLPQGSQQTWAGETVGVMPAIPVCLATWPTPLHLISRFVINE